MVNKANKRPIVINANGIMDNLRKMTWAEAQAAEHISLEEFMAMAEQLLGVMNPGEARRFADQVSRVLDYAEQQDFFARFSGRDARDKAVAQQIAQAQTIWLRARQTALWGAIALVISYARKLDSRYPLDPNSLAA